MANVLEKIAGNVGPNGLYGYTVTFSSSAMSAQYYRLRLFLKYDGKNDLSSRTLDGIYARSSNGGDRILYDDWNSWFRPALVDKATGLHNTSYNTEIVCEFAAGPMTRRIDLCDRNGDRVVVSGESYINREYADGNLPVNILLERRESTAKILGAAYVDGKVIVTTDGEHGFSTGDAITISGFPATEHSMGVNGERYNGTYEIKVTSPTEFTYSTMFYGMPGEHRSYAGTEGLKAEKWIVCEYTVDKEVIISEQTAGILWESHSFILGDHITVMNGDTPVAMNALVSNTAPNSFVCSSRWFSIGGTAGRIVYAPRTPSAKIPVNYSSGSSDSRGRKGRSRSPSALVNNRSTTDPGTFNTTSDMWGSYSLTDRTVEIKSPTMKVGNGSFGMFRFTPDFSLGMSDNHFTISLNVYGSTEVSTSVCLMEFMDGIWNPSNAPDVQFAKISKSAVCDAYEFTNEVCLFTGNCQGPDVTGEGKPINCEFEIDSKVGDRWVSGGRPVTLAVMLMGREGAVVDISTCSAGEIKVLQWIPTDSDNPEGTPIDIKVEPDNCTVGDVVTIYSTDHKRPFDPTLDGRLRVLVNGEPEEIISNVGSYITFIPHENAGGLSTVVVQKDNGGGDWVQYSSQETIVVSLPVLRSVHMNDRMVPGKVEGEITRNASYNRDLAFNGFVEVTDENSLIQNLYSCLLTRKGERLFNPDFGTTLEERIFRLRSKYDENYVLQECLEAIQTYEPRITLVYEQCGIEEYGENALILRLGVILPNGTNRQVNLPFKYRGQRI